MDHEKSLAKLRRLAAAKANAGRRSAVERVRAKYPDYTPPAHELAAVRQFAAGVAAGTGGQAA